MPTHIGRLFPPGGKHVEQLVHLALLAPDRQYRAGQLFSQVAFIVGQVYRRSRTIVFKARAYRSRQGEGTQIFGEHRLVDRILPETQRAKHVAQERLGAVGEHDLRQVGDLKEEPVPVSSREFLAGIAKHGVRRHDVEHCQIFYGVRIVHRQAMRNPRAAIMADHRKPLEAQRLHRFMDVLRHAALVVTVARLVGIAITAQVRTDHRETVQQQRRNLAPHPRCLRIAVQQHDRIPLAPDPRVDANAVGTDGLLLHSRHETAHLDLSTASSHRGGRRGKTSDRGNGIDEIDGRPQVVS